MNKELEELLIATQNNDIELINNLYEKLDESLLVLFLKYVKVITEEEIKEELYFLRELNFYKKGLFCQYYYVNSKREEYCHPVKIDTKMLKEFNMFSEGLLEKEVK